MSDWEIVETFGTEEEANLVAGYLAEQGIDARIESLLFHQEPTTFGALSEVRVLVPAGELERASTMVAEREGGTEVLAEGELSAAGSEGSEA
jgi:hypothetical protein